MILLHKIKTVIRKLFFNGKRISFKAKISNSTLDEYVQITDRANIINCKIGRYTSVGRNTNIYHTAIGNFCSISWNVTIGAPNHPIDRLTSHAFPYVKFYDFVQKDNKRINQTKIGHDVWIGANCIILSGLSIGNGCIIGAGSIITKDLPPYSIAVGNPGKIIKKRFSEDLILSLEKLNWWNWNKSKLLRNIHLFQVQLSHSILECIK